MAGKPRIFVAGLYHETHTFLEERTGLGEFEIRRGADLLEVAGDPSPLGGALATGAEAGWSWVPGADYRALPGGTVRDEVIEAFLEDIRQAWDPEIDGIFVVLHGAMVSQSVPDVEGHILRALRELPARAGLPLFGVYDLHANLSAEMAVHADGLVAYRENPHVDARESAVRAVELLRRSLESGARPRISQRRPGRIWSPIFTGTDADPMRSLEARARLAEASSPDIWAVNVAAGYAYADTPDTGVGFEVVGTAGEAETDRILDDLERIARDTEPSDLTGGGIPAAEAIEQIRSEPIDGLTVLEEPSDNIGAGAPGGGTGLLRALVESGLDDVAICIRDGKAVKRLRGAGEGDRLRVAIGGGPFDEGPLDLEVELVSRSDGEFALEDPKSHLASMCGERFEMGECAVVRHEGILVLLTTRPTPPFDLGQWRSQGIEPSRLRAIGVKAAVAHRRAYDPITARRIRVDTPGPCPSRLDALPYRWARLNSREEGPWHS